ncbi:MAG: endo-1,4-beta-xylanase [Acidobacteria bacterium]|nr:endo-1,4-beta-xylanase [Acidobacteriota bacterium]
MPPTQPRRWAFTIRAWLVVASLACSLGLSFLATLNPHTAIAQTGPLVQNDFEDGTLQGWIARGGGVVLTNTTEAAQTGARSLKTTNRTQGFHGPSLNVFSLLTKGATYQITASVRLITGTPATTVRITMQQTPTVGSNQFVTIAQNTNVTDAAWVTLTGLFSFNADMTGLLLYVESTSATASYYLDNFSITFLAPPPGPPPNTSGIATDFETNTTEGWTSRTGVETLTVTSTDQHGGNYSLLTTNRTSAFRGPSINVTNVMFNGSRYRISVWAKLAPGEPNTQLRVSLERRIGTITTFHTVVNNTTVTTNQWVNLKVVYDLVLANQTLILYVESASGTPSFYIDDFAIAFVPPPVAEPNIPSVYQSLSELSPIGAAVWQGDLSGEHAVLLKKHFNSITSENDMKWSSLQPTEGNFNFANADAQVSFAKTNNMRIRGHTLIWHQQTPAWVFNDLSGNPMTPTPENKALLLQRIENHIRAVVSKYKDDVYAWDVVNEVIEPNQPDGFRRSPWFNVIGPEYIERAFRIAHEVDPDAKLYINDFDTTNVTKRQFLFNLISDLKSRGVPIHGIGHQMHNNIDFPSARAIIDTIDMFHGLGVENEITELDVSIYSGSNPTIYDDYTLIPEDLFSRQGYRYRIFFDAFRQLKGKIGSITFWGQADDHTWLSSSTRVNAPLLFDQSLKKKFAYWGVIDPLQLPGADISTSISADSGTVLSGHEVSYTITVKNNQDSDVEDFLPDDDDLPAANISLVSAIPAGTVFHSLVAPPGWSCATPEAGGAGQVNCRADSLAVGASARLNLTVTVVCATPDGAEISNSATAASTTRDPNPAPNNTASLIVRVFNPPPVISGLVVDKPVLWPPNQRMVNITLTYNVSDNCDAGLVPAITISSDEPVNEPGEGKTAPDWEVIDAHHVRLRAEHTSTSPAGRTYTITLTFTDSAGTSSRSSVMVRVPR